MWQRLSWFGWPRAGLFRVSLQWKYIWIFSNRLRVMVSGTAGNENGRFVFHACLYDEKYKTEHTTCNPTNADNSALVTSLQFLAPWDSSAVVTSLQFLAPWDSSAAVTSLQFLAPWDSSAVVTSLQFLAPWDSSAAVTSLQFLAPWDSSAAVTSLQFLAPWDSSAAVTSLQFLAPWDSSALVTSLQFLAPCLLAYSFVLETTMRISSKRKNRFNFF